jgi:hypothetical protein
MAVDKILALAVLLAMPCMTAATAETTEQEKGQVLAVLQAVAEEWSNTQAMPSTSHFEAALTVVDNTPPYLFQGPEAVQSWLRAYRETQSPAATKAKTSLHFLEPRTIEIEGARAYIAVPAEWTVTLDGRSDVSHGVVTATLNRSSQGWRIAAWIWTPQ